MPQPPLPPVRPGRGLQRLVWVVRGMAPLGAAMLLLLPPLFWLDPGWVRAAGPGIAGVDGGLVAIDDRARLLGGIASVPAVLLGLVALWRLWRLFGEYAVGRVFGNAAQRHLRGFAAALLALALVSPLLRAAMSVALTLGNPPGQRHLVLSLSWNDYLSILCGAVLLAVAFVMADAVRLAEDNEGFV